MQIAGVNCRTELRNEKKAKEHKHSVLIPLLIFYTYTVTAIFFAESQPRELDPFCAACFIQRHR